MGMRDGESENLRLLEALLFAADAPRTPAELARHLPDGADVPALLEALQQHYAGRGVTLQRVGEAWAFRTAPDLADRLRVEQVETRKLSRAAVETLAIIAYHQPVTRAEIEEIRGVGLSKGTLDTLLEAGWVQPRGRRQSPGRPLTWGTTRAFLDHFGLADLTELPGLGELKAAGLLDTRPAMNALAARGELGEAESGGAADESAEPLDPAFGADVSGSASDGD
jgi:segregation and condensation protein B